jgi:hypothetical protein
MRAFPLLIPACLALGCSTGTGYTFEVNVTVPPDVQRAFFDSAPGFVMNRDLILGFLCAPKNETVAFHYEDFYRYSSCEKNRVDRDELSGTAYAFRPADSELQQLDERSRRALKCGQTSPVEDTDVMKDVFGYYYYNSVETQRQLAVGTSKGECVSSSRYVVNITLAVK